MYREALDAAAPRDLACGEFINVELTTKMARTGNQISPAESCYSYVTICQVRYPTVLAFIMHTHTKARGYSVRSFVGILNQSKPDLWNAAVVQAPFGGTDKRGACPNP